MLTRVEMFKDSQQRRREKHNRQDLAKCPIAFFAIAESAGQDEVGYAPQEASYQPPYLLITISFLPLKCLKIQLPYHRLSWSNGNGHITSTNIDPQASTPTLRTRKAAKRGL